MTIYGEWAEVQDDAGNWYLQERLSRSPNVSVIGPVPYCLLSALLSERRVMLTNIFRKQIGDYHETT
jgi:hypothetical protein